MRLNTAQQTVRQTLTSGRALTTHAVVRAAGFNGPLRVASLRTPEGTTLKAVVKQPWQQAVQERWTRRVAEQLGVERWYTDVRLRSDGRAFIEHVPGGTRFASFGPEGLRLAMQDVLNQTMSRPKAARLASRDSQLVLFLDYLLANSDRRIPNVMYREKTRLTMIDNGFIGMGDRNSKTRADEVLTPYLDLDFLEPDGRWSGTGTFGLKLNADAVDHIRSRMTPHALDRLHRVLQRVDIPAPAGTDPRLARNEQTNQALLGWIRSDHYRANLQARLDQVLTTGELRYRANV